jgi:hypothetical protein
VVQDQTYTAQTFTAGLTGPLTWVDLKLAKFEPLGPAPAFAVVEIRDVSGESSGLSERHRDQAILGPVVVDAPLCSDDYRGNHTSLVRLR